MNIKKSHVSDQVLSVLRKKIMLNELNEGDHLKEAELSKELAVSRGPIREAIAVLETEGLVERLINGRTVVRNFSIKDIRNLYQSRILLEEYALSHIDSEKWEEDKWKLYDCVDQMQDAHNKGIRDIESDINYHALLVSMTNNKTLIQLWNSLKGIILTLIDVTSKYVQPQQEKIVDLHRQVLDKLDNGDVERAKEILRIHLEDASDYYCQSLAVLNKEEKV